MWDDVVEDPKVKQSPSASSGLSSPISVTASVRSGILSITTKFPTRHEVQESSDESLTVETRQATRLEVPESPDGALTVKTKSESRHEARQSYGDFMSYYVADGDDNEEAGEPEEAEEEATPNPKPKRQPAKRKTVAKEKQPRQPRKKQASTPRPESVSPITSKPSPADRASKAPRNYVRQHPPQNRVRTPSSKPMGNYGLSHAPPLAHAQSNQRAPPVQQAAHPSNARQPHNGMQQPHGIHHANGMHGMQPPQPVQPPKPMPYTLLAEVITVKYHASVDEKVKKLQALSASLTVFGGGPAVRTPPASESGKPSENAKKLEDVQTKQDETKEAKTSGQCQAIFFDAHMLTSTLDKGVPVDNFLAIFDEESDDEGGSDTGRDTAKKENDKKSHSDADRPDADHSGGDHPLDKDSKNSDKKNYDEPQIQVEQKRYLEHVGVPDGPLTYGIQFIMDALHSWADQRVRQQRQQHVTMLQARMLPPAVHSSNGAASQNLPATLNGQAVPKMPDLKDTPEGLAIAAFRDVVESGCLQVNLILPADLAKAVSRLYLQIDHLINQGNKIQPEPPYQPVSYGPQIIAHQKRLDRFKEDQARRHHAAAQQGLQQMYGMPQPAMLGGYPQNAPFQNHMYAPPAGRRRSTPQVPGQPHGHLPQRVSLPAGAHGPSQPSANGHMAGTPPAVPGAPRPDGPQGLSNEERVRLMYAPNLRLPRSGQMMNFSFAHENPAALQAFGQGAFPTSKQGPGATVPSQPMTSPTVVMSSPAPPSATERPVSQNGKNSIKSERASRGHSDTDAHAHPPNPAPTPGFTAVNAPAKPAHDIRALSSKPKTPGHSHSDAVVLDDD
jgi:hypothetical protein